MTKTNTVTSASDDCEILLKNVSKNLSVFPLLGVFALCCRGEDGRGRKREEGHVQ